MAERQERRRDYSRDIQGEMEQRVVGGESRAYTHFDGNTVTKPSEEVFRPEKRNGEQVRRARRNREKAVQMSPLYVMFLAATCVVFLVVGASYLKVQASITERLAAIEVLEQELEELKDINEATTARIGVATDINEIYRIATQELGMVYPDDSQVIYYERTEREYVQQNEEIPKE